LEDIIKEFNEVFEGDASMEINGDKLYITICSRTLIIRLPSVIGVQATGLS